MSELQRQTIVTLLDKAVLGVVALFVAHRLNKKIELFRARRAFEGEFLRERTKRLDELYTLMLDLAAAARMYVRETMKYVEARKAPIFLGTSTDMDSALKKSDALSQGLGRTAARFQPWIGDDLAQSFAEYRTVVRRLASEQTAAKGPLDGTAIEMLEQRTWSCPA